MTSDRPPDHCPNDKHPCSGTTFHRYGKPKKKVRDVHVRQVRALRERSPQGGQRWKCTTCGHIFRVYPRGVTRREQSLRLQAMSVHYWLLGMSLGGVMDALEGVQCPLGRSTIYANLRQAGTAARRQQRERLRSKMHVQVVGMDLTHVRQQGKDKVVMQATDAATGAALEITPLRAEDERTITRYVRRIAKLTGCEAIVTDDADAFSETESGLPDKAAADAAGVPRRVGVPATRCAQYPHVAE